MDVITDDNELFVGLECDKFLFNLLGLGSPFSPRLVLDTYCISYNNDGIDNCDLYISVPNRDKATDLLLT